MRILFCWALLLLALSATSETAKEVALNGHTFTLPDGFTIELVAGPPLAERPITADFDEQGRLYVADSSGSNAKVEVQLAQMPHRIVRLEDIDGDGKFDRSVVFADKMMFPEGTLWYDGSLYVAAPPSIWKLTDTDGDGRADRREEWFQGKTLTGCANDLHGPYLGPDGWIYWCKGAFAQQTYPQPGGPDANKKPFVTRAAHIFRARPDGTGIEPVMTGGMDNPVDVVFTPGGERIFSTTFFQHPGGGQRDGLIHAIYGGVYGKVHNVLDGHPRTGDVMPVLTHMGPAAPCGLTTYESAAFGPEYRDNLFCCQFNLRKVSRHVLTPSGATFTTRDEDFVVSSNLDFHPTDVLEDADGSLLIVDTGGWYKLCCPSSQLAKPDVRGAIYRVRRESAARPTDPRGTTLAWSTINDEALVQLLGDDRPAVRRRAIHEAAKRGPKIVPILARALREELWPVLRRNAVWALTRVVTTVGGESFRRLNAGPALVDALFDEDETVRQAALHGISVARIEIPVDPLLAILAEGSAHNRRAAAEAVGRIGDRSATPRLLAAAASGSDRTLQHSLTFSLIELRDAEATRRGLASRVASEKCAALFALDAMGGGQLAARDVVPLLASDDPLIKHTALAIVEYRGAWGDAVAAWLREQINRGAVDSKASATWAELAGRFAGTRAAQEMITDELAAKDSHGSPARHLAVLQAIARSRLKEAPIQWIGLLSQLLRGPVSEQALAAIQALPVLKKPAPELAAALGELARSHKSQVVRLTALSVMPGGPQTLGDDTFAFVLASLSKDKDTPVRDLAARVLATAKLSALQLTALADALPNVGPMELDRVLAVFEQSTDEQVGLKLVAGLDRASQHASLRADAVRTRLAKFSPRVQQQAAPLLARLNAEAAQQQQRLEELLPLMQTGDIRRGQAIFQGAKAACSACHAIGYVGGRVGPDLTRVGGIRSDRDLLESILFPSASFVRSFEPLTVRTVDGQSHNGLVLRDSSDELVLATGVKEEVRLPRAEIDEVRPGTVSTMPAGLDKQLTVQELADLMAFLRTAK